jgi:hypothetical protein
MLQSVKPAFQRLTFSMIPVTMNSTDLPHLKPFVFSRRER